MKINRLPAFAAVLLAALLALPPALSAVITFVPLTSLDIAPGGTVTFEIYGMSVNSIGGYSLYLDSGDTGSLVQITGQALNTSILTYGGPAPVFPASLATTPMPLELGAFALSPLAADTSYLLGTATISLDALTPIGAYTIGNTVATVFTDPGFALQDYAPSSSFIVNVVAVPEPSEWGFLLLALLVLIVARRRSASSFPAYSSASTQRNP